MWNPRGLRRRNVSRKGKLALLDAVELSDTMRTEERQLGLEAWELLIPIVDQFWWMHGIFSKTHTQDQTDT